MSAPRAPPGVAPPAFSMPEEHLTGEWVDERARCGQIVPRNHMKRTIFYSWQSQLPNSTNRSFIQEALEAAALAVRTDATIDARPEVDRDTANVPGSPNIADTIRAKIDAAEIVVCDVTIVQGLDGDGVRVRPTPNANVLVELGYAVKSLGDLERLVLVMNTAFGTPDMLPFDLRQWRVTTYSLPQGAAGKADVRKALASKLEATVRDVLGRGSRHAPPQPIVDERQLAILKDQLARFTDQAQQNNILAFAKKLDVIAVHYDGQLLDGAVESLAPALSANPQTMSRVQGVQAAIRTANAHAEQWRRAGWPSGTSVLGVASEDARAIMNSAKLALDGINLMFPTG